jgi:hypothetical protein
MSPRAIGVFETHFWKKDRLYRVACSRPLIFKILPAKQKTAAAGSSDQKEVPVSPLRMGLPVLDESGMSCARVMPAAAFL